MNDSPKATHYGVWILNEEKDVKIENEFYLCEVQQEQWDSLEMVVKH